MLRQGEAFARDKGQGLFSGQFFYPPGGFRTWSATVAPSPPRTAAHPRRAVAHIEWAC
jgi:hypothetical protein